MNTKPIKVLIVDDSTVVQSLLKFIIESDPSLKVMNTAENGEDAIKILQKDLPDVITMDIIMPKMDGFEVTKRILKQWPIPIIIVSEYYDGQDVDKCFRAMEAGALAILEKPKGVKDLQYLETARSLVETIKALANIKLAKWENIKKNLETNPLRNDIFQNKEIINKKINAVAIGASIGGPPALSTILAGLSSNFPVPIFIVQHISGGFVQGLLDWLSRSSHLEVCIAKHGQKALPGNVYIAPDRCHLEINKDNIMLLFDVAKNEKGFCPSIARLFHSMADAHGPHGVGILLGGIGNDGVDDLLYMRKLGAFTIAQDESTSVIFGKPKKAIQLGAVQSVLPLQNIAPTLERLVKRVKHPLSR